MNAADLSVPVGGVVPWMGEFMGLSRNDLPDNFIVVDGSVVTKGAINQAGDFSSFEGVTLPNTNGRSLVGVSVGTDIGKELGSNITKVLMEKQHIPTNVTLNLPTSGNSYQTSSSVSSNLSLSSVGMNVSVETEHFSGDGSSTYQLHQAMTIDNGSNKGTSGSGYYRPYVLEGDLIYRGTHLHSHKVNTTHKHSFRCYNTTPVSTSLTTLLGSYISQGVSVDTSYDKFNTASVLYIMRIY